MRGIGVILVGVAFALAGCGGGAKTGQTTETGLPTAQADDRAVAVYSAVVRQVATKDHTFGAGETPFDRIFIDVRIDDGAGDPNDHPPGGEGQKLTAETQAAILRELVDLPPVQFVEDPDSVVVGKKRCAHVRGNGVLITLGPISGDDDRVTVPNSMFFACLGGQWLTYVLEGAEDDWRVTGTEGPIAIS